MARNETIVIIISHDRPKTLKRAINSIRKQTYKDYKLVVVDDSKDFDKFEFLKDVDVLHSSTPTTQAEAWSIGIKYVHEHYPKAKYIKILLDDDWLHPHFLVNAVRLLDCHEDCNLLFTGARVEFPDKPLDLYALCKHPFKFPTSDFINRCKSPGNGGMPESPSCCLFRNDNKTNIRVDEFMGTPLEEYAKRVYFNDLLVLMDYAKGNRYVMCLPHIYTHFGTDANSITLTDNSEVGKAREMFRQSLGGY